MNFSIPTYLSDFSAQEDGRTVATLKVMYVGETADGRVFDEKFSKDIAATLADCPVVAYYSDIKKDFLGHNSTQYVFGHVPSHAEYRFEEDEDQKTWLKTEVILYTDRVDNIGAIASKIVGHPHSLELDPKTVKYEFFKENGKTKIHFTQGRVFGLSVLGMDEKPAFTGSAFLNCKVTDLQAMKEKFENFFNYLEEESRGGQMNEKMNEFENLLNAAKLSYSEKERCVAEKVNNDLGDDYCSYIVEMYDDEVIVATYNYRNGEEQFLRVKYSIDESGLVTLSETVEVFQVWATREEIESKQEFKKEEKEIKCERDPQDDDDDDKDQDKFEGAANAEAQDNEDFADIQTDTSALYQSALSELETLKIENSEFKTEKAALESELSATKSQLDAAMVELNAFKLERKMNLINSYVEDLDETTIVDFKSRVDEFNYSELESQLALSFTKIIRTNKANNNVSTFDFSTLSSKNNEVTTDNSYEALVKKYSNRTK